MPRTRYDYFDKDTVPKVTCPRGTEVELWDTMTNSCDCGCGAEFNGSGQRLADRSQWGEETGEHPADLGRLSDFNSRERYDDEQ